MIRRLNLNFFKGRNWIIYRHMERIGIEGAISYTLNLAVFFLIDSSEATGETFGWGGEQ